MIFIPPPHTMSHAPAWHVPCFNPQKKNTVFAPGSSHLELCLAGECIQVVEAWLS